MQAFRIALGLCALLLAWMLCLPPSALGPLERKAPAAREATLASPDASRGTTPAAETEEVASGSVRMIGPAAVETEGALHRLPAVASGAAEPPVAELPGPDAPAEAPLTGETAAAAEAVPEDTAAASAPPLEAQDARRFSAPIALDTGTIRSGEALIHIAGIAPIAPETRCADGPRSWPCGVRARTEFRAWLRGRTLTCDPSGEGAPDAPTACRLGEEDVGDWLVRNGWANAEPGSRYEADAEAARKAGRGVWQFEVTRQGAVE